MVTNNVLRKLDNIFTILMAVAVPVALYFVFIYAPVEKSMGLIQKIFYFHVSSAWIGFFAFFVTFSSSLVYLNKKDFLYDDIAFISAKIGLIFCTIVIVTGPLWARPVWGVYWMWEDVRLTTMLILWFLYAGYIALRNAIEDKNKKAKYSAILGIIGFIDVPVVFFSIRLWKNGVHPNVLQKGGGGIDSDMLTALFISLITFTIIYFALLIRELRITKLEKQLINIRNLDNGESYE